MRLIPDIRELHGAAIQSKAAQCRTIQHAFNNNMIHEQHLGLGDGLDYYVAQLGGSLREVLLSQTTQSGKHLFHSIDPHYRTGHFLTYHPDRAAHVENITGSLLTYLMYRYDTDLHPTLKSLFTPTAVETAELSHWDARRQTVVTPANGKLDNLFKASEWDFDITLVTTDAEKAAAKVAEEAEAVRIAGLEADPINDDLSTIAGRSHDTMSTFRNNEAQEKTQVLLPPGGLASLVSHRTDNRSVAQSRRSAMSEESVALSVVKTMMEKQKQDYEAQMNRMEYNHVKAMRQHQVNSTLAMETAMDSAMERMQALLGDKDQNKEMMDIDTGQNNSGSNQDNDSNQPSSNHTDDEHNDIRSETSQEQGYMISAEENAKNNDAGDSESSAGVHLV